MLQVRAAPAAPTIAPDFHHIGVQTSDLDNCVSWYQDFFGGQPTWTLSRFSELTLKRLPGIVRLSEMLIGNMRVHLFEIAPAEADQRRRGTRDPGSQFQHVCLRVGSPEELSRWRRHWIPLYASGRYVFARPEQPTEIVRDSDGVESFYALDVNGLEYEFTYVPEDRPR